MSVPDLLETGADWAGAEIVVILLHAHGQRSEELARLAAEIDSPQVRYLLPAAEGGLWFPKPIEESFEENAAMLGQSLSRIGAVLADLKARGISQERTVLGGYSHGACVAAEYLTRNARSYGGALLLRGGQIDIAAIGRRPGSGLLGVPVYVSGSETDTVVPVARPRGIIRTLQAGSALIRSHVFAREVGPITGDEILAARQLLEDVKKAAAIELE